MRPEVVTKSSIMLGLGEQDHEVEQTLRDLRDVGVEMVTFGQCPIQFETFKYIYLMCCIYISIIHKHSLGTHITHI